MLQENEATELTLRLEEANKLAQELSDRKKELKAAMFSDKLASFSTFPSIDEAFLVGELTLAHVQLPFKKLDLAIPDLKPVDILAEYDFLLPLDNGQRIVLFEQRHECVDFEDRFFTQMSCFDRLSRLLDSGSLNDHIESKNVAQCGPSTFVVYNFYNAPDLRVYDADLKCLRKAYCNNYSVICSNSKFVFGLWYTNVKLDDANERDLYSSEIIRVHDLDTLNVAFSLRVTKKHIIQRIMADENHLVTMNRLEKVWSDQWSMSIFDLQAKSGMENGDFFLAERHVEMGMLSSMWLPVFLHCEWLILQQEKELVWYDKNGNRSETRTQLDTNNMLAIYSSGSSLIFTMRNNKKQCRFIYTCIH